MARIKQGILGGFSGKVANIVGSSWKGIPVMKSRPLSVANPKTAAQTTQRNKFSQAVAFAVVILTTIVKPLWDRFAIRKSGFNAFIQTNIDAFNASGLNTPADLKIADGNMSATAIDSVTATNASPDASVEWTNDSGEGSKLSDDIAYVCVYNEDTGNIEGFETEATRADELADIVITPPTTGDKVWFWLAFKRADGTVVSQTAHKSTTV
jgi:hypothetical protein